MGEGAHLVRCRCLLRGTWPVLSCRSRLVRFLDSVWASVRNLFEGRELSVLDIHGNLGEHFQYCAALLQSFCRKACLAAALLAGRGLWSACGSWDLWLEVPSAAPLASSSTCSFPSIPQCPGVQWI